MTQAVFNPTIIPGLQDACRLVFRCEHNAFLPALLPWLSAAEPHFGHGQA